MYFQTAFFKRFKAMLDARDLTLHGAQNEGFGIGSNFPKALPVLIAWNTV